MESGIRYRFQIITRYAGRQIEFGWYEGGGGLEKIFSFYEGVGTEKEIIFPEGVREIGFYVYYTFWRESYWWYSEVSRNSDGKDHALILETDRPGEYVIAFEDLPELGDRDFQDIGGHSCWL